MSLRCLSLRARALAFAALVLLVAIPSLAVSPPGGDDILPVSQLKPGMRGYGLTVFKGTQIERFDVEILGVLPQLNQGRPLILVRIGGGQITARQTNIVAGMSGSPVYVGGKLVGAVAYGGVFSKEPIGMLTPIEDMLEALDPNLPDKPSGQSSEFVPLPKPVRIGSGFVDGVLIQRRPAASTMTPDSGSTMTIFPLATPLMISGMSARGIERLSPLFESLNLMAMPGPGPLAKKVSVRLEPGAAVGVALATGDIEIAGVGTLTYAKGNKVLAMGHPLLGIGPLGAALTTAYVHDIMPSYLVSTKMASLIEVVGSSLQDRPFSISGEIGKPPDMIPVNVVVRDVGAKRGQRFGVRVINHPLLSPTLIVAVVGEAIYRVRSVPGDAVAKVSFEVDADEVGKIKRENVFFDRLSIDSAAVGDLADLMSVLSRNRFYQLDVKRVVVNVEIASRRNTATLERIFVPESKYRPGDEIEVGVVLRPYKSPPVTQSVKVKIPSTLPTCKATLMVRGGGRSAGVVTASSAIGEKPDQGEERVPIRDSSASEVVADNVRQLVDKYLEKEKNTEIVAKLILPDSAVTVSGEKLTNLPPVIAESFKNAKATGLKLQREEVKAVQQTDWIVAGAQSIPITIERRESSEKARPPASPSGGQPESRPPSEVAYASGSSDEDDSDWQDYGQTEPLRPMASSLPVSNASPPTPTAQPQPASPPAPTEETKPEAKPAARPSDGKMEKSVARQVTMWTQTVQKDFAPGYFDGVAATSADDIRPVPKISLLANLNEQFVWCIVPYGDGAVVGTGNEARVYKVSSDGKASLLADLPGLAVHSLVVGKSGEIYAGTGPDGKVYRIAPDGKHSSILDTGQKYVVALACDQKGDVFAGTGDAPKVFRIDANGKSNLFVELPGKYVLSLAADSTGTLYAGTGGSACVYAVKPDGTFRAIYDAGDQAVSALKPDGKGAIYAATTTKGLVAKIGADGAIETLYSGPSKSALGLDLWQGRALALYADKPRLVDALKVVADTDSSETVQFTAMAVSPKNGAIYVGASNGAALYVSRPAAPKGVYESVAHDAKLQSAWGRIKWTADVPEGAKVVFQTRTGNTSDPDATWSPWSPVYAESGQQILSPAARYIQYRATLEGATWERLPTVKDVSISFLTRNQAPTLKITSPVGGETWSRKQTIKWTGQDPDGDTLTYQAFYSSDGGKTWQELTEQPSKPAAGPAGIGEQQPAEEEAADEKEPSEEEPADVTVEKGTPKDANRGDRSASFDPSHPAPSLAAKQGDKHEGQAKHEKDKGKDVKTQPAAPSAITSTKADTIVIPPPKPAPAAKSVGRNTSYNWDTSKVPDGKYVVKVVVTDKTSNATGWLTDEKISDPFIICNTPPTLVALQRDVKIGQDRRAVVLGIASSKLARITGVDYRVDGGDWQATRPLDGIFDSLVEEFELSTDPLEKGDRELEVKAVDSAGNSTTTKLKVKVEG